MGREMELLVFGHGGRPVVVFPTASGHFFEFEDRGMVQALAEGLECGSLQLFCVDSIDRESWHNRKSLPADRVVRHMRYETYLIDEVVPFVKYRNPAQRFSTAGCSFGGYHALNFALKHPHLVDRCLSMSGTFDVRPYLDGYYDENAYFNNPAAFLPLLNDQAIIDEYTHNVQFVLATGERDMCLDDNLQMAQIMHEKRIPHNLDIWGSHAGHDWEWWKQMAKKFLM